MFADLRDKWQDDVWLRLIVVGVLLCLAVLAAWFFGFAEQMATWGMPWLVWATVAGLLIAGISLVVSPILEQYT